MKISELKIGQGKVDIQATIKSKEPERVFNKYGRDLKVANAVASDDSGAIKISLWNEDVAKVNEGDKIKVTNGYVSEFNGEKQLSAGKYGKIEVIDSKSTSQESPKDAPKEGAKEAKPKKVVKSAASPDFEEKEF